MLPRLNVMDTASKPILRTDAPSFGRTEGSGPELSSFTLDNGLDVVVIPGSPRARRHPHDLVSQRLGR